MNLQKQYPILVKLLSVFRRSQQKTCLAIVAAILDAAQANTFQIAACLAVQNRIELASAVNRFLRNQRFDNRLLTKQLFSFLARRGQLFMSWIGQVP